MKEKLFDSNAIPQMTIYDAVLLDRDGLFDLVINDGRITSIKPASHEKKPVYNAIDARGGLVTPSFADAHFHLDKVLSRDILGATKFEEAFKRAREAKTHFTVKDVEERASRALELAVAHGLGRMRANVDVDSFTGLVSMEGILRARERFSRAIDIEVIAFPQEGIVSDPQTPDLLREALKMGDNIIAGGLPEFERTVEDQRTHINTIFDIAEEADVSIDMHCDYTDQIEYKTLEMFADATLERGFQGRVTAGHCCALSLYPMNEANRVIDKIKAARMDITVLPVANLQMLGGQERTPVNRGSSRVLELLDAGVNVSAGADNMYDIWYRFNRMDPVEIGYITCLSGGMRTDEEVREAFNMVTERAARALGVENHNLCEGAAADLVVFEADNITDIFRNLPGRRIHIKRGRQVGGIDGSQWVSVG